MHMIYAVKCTRACDFSITNSTFKATCISMMQIIKNQFQFKWTGRGENNQTKLLKQYCTTRIISRSQQHKPELLWTWGLLWTDFVNMFSDALNYVDTVGKNRSEVAPEMAKINSISGLLRTKQIYIYVRRQTCSHLHFQKV